MLTLFDQSFRIHCIQNKIGRLDRVGTLWFVSPIWNLPFLVNPKRQQDTKVIWEVCGTLSHHQSQDTAYERTCTWENTVPNADDQYPSPSKYPNWQGKRDAAKIKVGQSEVIEDKLTYPRKILIIKGCPMLSELWSNYSKSCGIIKSKDSHMSNCMKL